MEAVAELRTSSPLMKPRLCRREHLSLVAKRKPVPGRRKPLLDKPG
jgi:hypothetical protein